MSPTPSDTSAVTFETVLAEERRSARSAQSASLSPEEPTPSAERSLRAHPPADQELAPKTTAADESGPVGLALSGGGIRSATFSLGVLQALAKHDKLDRFDYLSTVSGGGYIGGWLSAWIHRKGLEAVAKGLKASAATGAPEPYPVQWLRRYSNYLTPRAGLFSLDALTVAATWLRNVLLNLIVLISFLAALFLLPIAVFFPGTLLLLAYPNVSKWAALVFGLVALSFAAINLTINCEPEGKRLALLTPLGVMATVIFPGFLAAGFASCWLFVGDFNSAEWPRYIGVSLLAFFVAVGIAWAIGIVVSHRCSGQRITIDTRGLRDGLVYLAASIPSVALGAGLLAVAWHLLPTPSARIGEDTLNLRVVQIITWGPPTILLCFGICVSVWIGLVGREFYEPSREWWSRTGGTFISASVGCFAWFALAFYVPPAVESLYRAGHGWLHVAASSSWIGSLIGALVIAFQKGPAKNERGPNWRIWLGVFLTSLFALGLFVLIACGLHAGLDGISRWRGHSTEDLPNYFSRLSVWHAGFPSAILIALLGSAAVALVFAWRVDVNRFSLHNMYKNRIIRCYLGASNEKRLAQPFTGFDRNDDIPLASLADKAGSAQRPVHIINTAMNLVQGSELAWQQRKAASFVFTPTYCGFAMATAQGDQSLTKGHPKLPGFRPTAEYASLDPSQEDRGFSLGMAVATSGAALSPNMGAHSQPALAALMTFFNVRLGRWSPNPARDKWKQASPRFGLAWLLAELLGYTNESRAFVYLSDGGHFENMGVYELVRRRCRRIIAVDAGADSARTFEDLGNMLRKCRVDLDTEIKIELSDLYSQDDQGRCKSGFVIGTISYPKDGGADPPDGQILLIKPSLYKPPAEAADLYNYASGTAFPQESTVDQWFDESQFESYRSLGYCLANDALSTHPSFLMAEMKHAS